MPWLETKLGTDNVNDALFRRVNIEELNAKLWQFLRRVSTSQP